MFKRRYNRRAVRGFGRRPDSPPLGAPLAVRPGAWLCRWPPRGRSTRCVSCICPGAGLRRALSGAAGGTFAGWMGRRRTKNGLIKKKSKNGTAIRTREVKLNSCTSVTNRTKNTAPAMAATAASG